MTIVSHPSAVNMFEPEKEKGLRVFPAGLFTSDPLPVLSAEIPAGKVRLLGVRRSDLRGILFILRLR